MIDSDYSHVIFEGGDWLVDSVFLPRFPVRLPPTVEAGESVDGAEILNNKSGRVTVRLSGSGNEGSSLIVKRYRPRSAVELAKYFLCRTRAQVEWERSGQFTDLGVPAPRVLAYGERRCLGVWRESNLVMMDMKPCTTLREALVSSIPEEDKDWIVRQLAGYVAAIHNGGFHYRDLHGDNILVTGGKKRAGLVFIDLHEVRRFRRIHRWMCVDDLGRLNSHLVTTRARRFGFLKEYLSKRGIGADKARRRKWARDIDRRSRQIWARNYRKRGIRVDTY